MIGDPPVVFMNDPTSGFDPESKRYLWQIIAARQRGGQALVLASHELVLNVFLFERLKIIIILHFQTVWMRLKRFVIVWP